MGSEVERRIGRTMQTPGAMKKVYKEERNQQRSKGNTV